MTSEPIRTFDTGRVRCSVYVRHDHTEGLGYEVELYHWEKPTKRSQWRRVHRHRRCELQDVVDALNSANEWMDQNPVRLGKGA